MIGKLCAFSWVLVLAGVGMRWPALVRGGLVAFLVFAGVWCVLLARSRPRG